MASRQHPSQVKLNSADSSDLRRLSGTKDTSFWLYSISALPCPRFMFNLTAPLLNDIKSGSCKIAEVSRLMNPLDLYLSAIAEYDKTFDTAKKSSSVSQWHWQ